MGPWGQHLERGETWWEQSRAWLQYIARCQYLLQQGLFVADIFSQIDPLLDAETAKASHARLVIIVSPAELPVGPDRMWTRLKDKGKMVSLDLAEEDDVKDYLPQLLTGGKAERRQQESCRTLCRVQGKVSL